MIPLLFNRSKCQFSFIYQSIKFWNNLPSDLKSSDSAELFTRKLKNHLSSRNKDRNSIFLSTFFSSFFSCKIYSTILPKYPTIFVELFSHQFVELFLRHFVEFFLECDDKKDLFYQHSFKLSKSLVFLRETISRQKLTKICIIYFHFHTLYRNLIEVKI